MKIKILLLFNLLLIANAVSAQRKMEALDRGLVAVRSSDGVFVSWRILGEEWYGVTYNLYRDGEKLNSEPLEVSNYMDDSGSLSSNYSVTAIIKGEEQTPSASVQPLTEQYLEIPLVSRPEGYHPNDATAADLDGDGEYEIIVKRVISDWSEEATQFAYFEAYKMDGTLMWEINVGPNIMSSAAVEINIAAFDLDEDGKAEVFLRTSEGTIFGDGTKIGDTDGDGKTNYRYSVLQSSNMQYMNEGPEFLSLVDGETGVELDRVDFIPRGKSSDWGDNYGHRANKFFFGAPYLDGKKPSIFIGRGIYTKTIMRTYDVVNKELVPRWEFSSLDNPGYGGQGNHNMTIADVDEDGRDEIVYGSMTVDDDGTGLYTTELGHGDAMHVGDFDPFRKGIEVWRCLENSPMYGTVYHDGATGEILIHDVLGRDCGRCMAANISDEVMGATLWGSTTKFSASTKNPVNLETNSVNFRIYWDGDLLEELLNHNWNGSGGEGTIQKSGHGDIFTATGTSSNNWTKGTPALQADLFGDWREEVIWRTADNEKIRIYTTIDPTPYRVYTLMHDHQYRQAICWQMCGYNQPPHTSFFLGEKEGITAPPPPMITNGRLVFKGGGVWDKTSANWLREEEIASFEDGDQVLFDVSNGEDVTLSLSETVTPANLTVNSSGDYTLNASAGKIAGNTALVKQGDGTFFLVGSHDYSGETQIWNGRLSLEGNLTNSPVWVNLFGELAAKGQLNKGVNLRHGSSLYVGGDQVFGDLEINDSIKVESKSELVFDLHSSTESPNDTLKINGDIILEDGVVIRVVPHLVGEEEQLAPGSYVIAKVTGEINLNLDNIAIKGILGTPAFLKVQDGTFALVIKDTRDATSVIWNGSNSNVWDLATTSNFLNNEVQDVFVTGDDVEINDDAVEQHIVISEDIIPNSVKVINTNNFSFSGEGSISGTSSLTKSGSGKLTISNDNTFSGKITINEGTISVSSLPNDLSGESPLGPVSDNASLFEINGGVLSVSSETSMDRAVNIGPNGGTLIHNNQLTWNGAISGEKLAKSGSGELVIGGVNSNSELVIKGGKVRLLNEEAYPGSLVTIEDGTLIDYDNNYSYSTSSFDLQVPESSIGHIYLDGRCSYTGTLTGAGKLNVYIPFVRSDFNGNWSEFSGTLNIKSTKGDDVPFRINNNHGYPKAIVNIDTPIFVEPLSGGTIKFGVLTGTGTLGNATWEIGGRNEDFEFNGSFSSGSVKKVGTGTMDLKGVSIYSGSTSVINGTLLANNPSGSATGTGSVSVESGAFLGGEGTITGPVQVNGGGTLYAGDPANTGSSLKVNSVIMEEGSKFHVKVNGGSSTSDKIVVSGSFTANGLLIMENTSFNEFELGRSYKIVSASSIDGSFESISPETPGDGLEWDTSKFNSKGEIRVGLTTAIDNNPKEKLLGFYPNPTEGLLHYKVNYFGHKGATLTLIDINGKMVFEQEITSNEGNINLSSLENGMYVVQIFDGVNLIKGKIIKK